ncbi:hypothetical protein M9458_041262, partial [Cirrhinus mrigala]
MSEIETFLEDNSFETADPAAPLATVQVTIQVAAQATSNPQDPTIEPETANHAITIQASATFSSVFLCFSPLLRSWTPP